MSTDDIYVTRYDCSDRLSWTPSRPSLIRVTVCVRVLLPCRVDTGRRPRFYHCSRDNSALQELDWGPTRRNGRREINARLIPAVTDIDPFRSHSATYTFSFWFHSQTRREEPCPWPRKSAAAAAVGRPVLTSLRPATPAQLPAGEGSQLCIRFAEKSESRIPPPPSFVHVVHATASSCSRHSSSRAAGRTHAEHCCHHACSARFGLRLRHHAKQRHELCACMAN